MKYIFLILIIAFCSAVYAKDLGALHGVIPGEMLNADDYNILVNHTQELERKVGGMQKCITELYSRINKLEKK